MNILIIGNMGYVGPSVIRRFRTAHPDAYLSGFDTGYFAHCLTGVEMLPELLLHRQYFGDVREITPSVFDGVDAVVELAAISNDPMGNRFEAVTKAINFQSSVDIAKMAHASGVRNYVFASSCSVYGAAGDAPRCEDDPVNPLTAYARSKIGTENELRTAELDSMTITCLRFATACGMSDRLRLDLVLNDFVACAIASKKITVLSDGTPWRPLITVEDMARAIDWAATRKAENGGGFLVVNAGSKEWNYQVKDLANAVAGAIPGTEVSINTSAQPDKRSYQVDFSLFHKLASGYTPQVTLNHAIAELRDGLLRMNFSDQDFRNSQNMRLKVLEGHLAAGRLGADLRWK